MTDKTKWFYEINSEKKGPVIESQIEEMISNGTIGYGTKVWKEGFPEWLKIENTDLEKLIIKLSPFKNNTENTSTNSSMDSFLTKVKSSPLLLIISALPILLLVTALIADNSIFALSASIVLGIIGFALAMVDRSKLIKSGKKAPNVISAFFYPVYLFKRNNNIFITWVVLYVITAVLLYSTTFTDQIEKSAASIIYDKTGISCNVKVYDKEGNTYYAKAIGTNGDITKIKIEKIGDYVYVTW